MKKLAIIGTSNTIVSHGYVAKMREAMGEEVDIFPLGACTSGHGVFTLLSNSIIDHYEYVLFDFNINDTFALTQAVINEQTLFSYVLFVANSFNFSSSIPLFLILPSRLSDIAKSASYIWRSVACLYNIKIIDIEKNFLNIPTDVLVPNEDKCHYYPIYQEKIAKLVLSIISHGSPHPTPPTSLPQKINLVCDKINFQLFDFNSLKNRLPILHIGTSLMTKSCHIISLQHNIQFPSNSYICGLFYWQDNYIPYLIFKYNQFNQLAKKLNSSWKGFFARDIAWSKPDGLKVATLTLSACKPHLPIEQSYYQNNSLMSDQCSKLLCVDFLLSDLPPFRYGDRFITNYPALIMAKKDELRRHFQ